MSDIDYSIDTIIGDDGVIRMKVTDVSTGKYVFGTGKNQELLRDVLKCQLTMGDSND